jgi:molecular chaperone HtpG
MTDTIEQDNGIPFSVDISRMIELLAAQIYPSPFALLRENVQNAFDAIMLRRHRGDVFEPEIDVTIKPFAITVQDNGIGMSWQELKQHFWRAGSSSKNTVDARAAGVVGTFGIGAMANFGIADRLDVVSESTSTNERTHCWAERATLSVTDSCIKREDEHPTGAPGTIITATIAPTKPIDVVQAVAYITEFIRFVDLPVRVNGNIVSQGHLAEAVPGLQESWRWEGPAADLGHGLVADVSLTGSGSGEVRIDLSSIVLDGMPLAGRLILRQGGGPLRTFRSRFGLAAAAIPTAYQLGGVADFLVLKPTAGREALTTESQAFLNRFGAPIDELISAKLAQRPEANVNMSFVGWVAGRRRWDLCGNLRARIEPGDSATLSELRGRSEVAPLLVYAGTDPSIMGHASSERPLVQLARNQQRRECELGFLQAYCKIEQLTDEPKVVHILQPEEMRIAHSSLAFRLADILSSDYFLSVDVKFGRISHSLPILIDKKVKPVTIYLDPGAANVAVIIEVYEREYGAFGHMAKDFVRNVVFPKVSDLVPSATRQGAEAFLKSLSRTRDVFEYETTDLENLTNLWNDYLGGKLTMQQATTKASAVRRSYQTIDAGMAGAVRDVVPDVVTNEQLVTTADAVEPTYEALPSIERLDTKTDRKILTIADGDPPLKGYRCFIAISNRIREERGDFFLQPHRTSVVWGGQKILFIFEHQSGEFGLYYDVQMNEPVASSSGGGSFQTCTIVMKNQVFIPIPENLRSRFLPREGEVKRLEVRCDLLYMDRSNRPD